MLGTSTKKNAVKLGKIDHRFGQSRQRPLPANKREPNSNAHEKKKNNKKPNTTRPLKMKPSAIKHDAIDEAIRYRKLGKRSRSVVGDDLICIKRPPEPVVGHRLICISVDTITERPNPVILRKTQ